MMATATKGSIIYLYWNFYAFKSSPRTIFNKDFQLKLLKIPELLSTNRKCFTLSVLSGTFFIYFQLYSCSFDSLFSHPIGSWKLHIKSRHYGNPARTAAGRPWDNPSVPPPTDISWTGESSIWHVLEIWMWDTGQVGQSLELSRPNRDVWQVC